MLIHGELNHIATIGIGKGMQLPLHTFKSYNDFNIPKPHVAINNTTDRNRTT